MVKVCHLLCAGKHDLELKLGTVKLVSEYVDVVTWFVMVGLLPEHPGLLSYLLFRHLLVFD